MPEYKSQPWNSGIYPFWIFDFGFRIKKTGRYLLNTDHEALTRNAQLGTRNPIMFHHSNIPLRKRPLTYYKPDKPESNLISILSLDR
jgi:hypothetical protein